jgi:hypothetical protein
MAGIGLASEIVLVLDARVALVSLMLLSMAAVAPIVLGWLALLPSEREPFAFAGESGGKKQRDPFAIFLLVNISISLLLRIPGLDAVALSSRIARLLPAEWGENTVMIAFIWFGFIPGLAAAYSAVRANPIRWQLLVGGVLTLVLWLAGPWLLTALVGTA